MIHFHDDFYLGLATGFLLGYYVFPLVFTVLFKPTQAETGTPVKED